MMERLRFFRMGFCLSSGKSLIPAVAKMNRCVDECFVYGIWKQVVANWLHR